METFRVDLRGVIDLLARHLYSSPRVYVRELLQNAVDAITARRSFDPEAPATVRVEVLTEPAPGLRVTDSGVGLTGDEMRELLATIGRSSKRDDFEFARADFLGQFGIGLLACFLVADEIVVRSRSARDLDSPTMLWRGRADGTFDLDEATDALAQPGTEVTLTATRDAGSWFAPSTVSELVTHYGSLLPIDVEVTGHGVLTGQRPPWLLDTDAARRWCRREFGFEPFDVVELSVPVAGVRGVAFILSQPANPAEQPRHRVYLKQMLLSESVEGVLPDWAFFARCVIDTTVLRPTASRESLYDDPLLTDAREALGRLLRDWLLRLQVVDPTALTRFLRIHHIGVKAMALHDDDMLDVVRDALPFETSAGTMTIAEFGRQFARAGYTRTVDQFRAMAAVAAGQGYGLIDAGYVYDEECLLRLAERPGGLSLAPADPLELGALLGTVPSGDELTARPLLRTASAALAGNGCEVVLRQFSPASIPALYLPEPDAAGREIARSGRVGADELWSGLLDATDGRLGDGQPRAQLVLNHLHPLVRKLVSVADTDVVRDVVGGLYGQALLQGRHPMRPADTATLNGALLSLVERATGP